MQHKIVGLIICLLIIFGSFPLTANIISNNQQMEPEGKILFISRAAGPCCVAWGYWLGPGPNPTPDAYIESGKGFIFGFGTMPYHSLNSPYFTNYIIEDNEGEVLWNLREITLMKINWQHEGVNHNLQVTCTSLEETTGTFSPLKSYLICVPPMLSNPKNPESNCMTFTGVHRNGSKTEHIAGFAVFSASAGVDDPLFSFPIIGTLLFDVTDEGELEPLLSVIWAKETLILPGFESPIEKARIFHVNYWLI